jgi:hypothetical protein
VLLFCDDDEGMTRILGWHSNPPITSLQGMAIAVVVCTVVPFIFAFSLSWFTISLPSSASFASSGIVWHRLASFGIVVGCCTTSYCSWQRIRQHGSSTHCIVIVVIAIVFSELVSVQSTPTTRQSQPISKSTLNQRHWWVINRATIVTFDDGS